MEAGYLEGKRGGMDNEDNDKRKQKGKHHFWITRVLLPIAFALIKILMLLQRLRLPVPTLLKDMNRS
ncbi:homeobox-leucine zipper protein ROC8-like isoform X1 [Iris pallida]|uniref:Homeobox-leucine zipper protein ROC8-like isoform X1 n=1 Tax=Iris pallida TaxID=29817 RepID=A0AAX6G0W9_IRIPA|nr:homeobox-leucine zipper protein ROC8-like isoform X1 [Iris pallida]